MDFGRFSGQSGTKYGASPFPVSGGLAAPINIQGYLGSIMVQSHTLSGRNSGVECLLPKQDVVGSNPIARSKLFFGSEFTRVVDSVVDLRF